MIIYGSAILKQADIEKSHKINEPTIVEIPSKISTFVCKLGFSIQKVTRDPDLMHSPISYFVAILGLRTISPERCIIKKG